MKRYFLWVFDITGVWLVLISAGVITTAAVLLATVVTLVGGWDAVAQSLEGPSETNTVVLEAQGVERPAPAPAPSVSIAPLILPEDSDTPGHGVVDPDGSNPVIARAGDPGFDGDRGDFDRDNAPVIQDDASERGPFGRFIDTIFGSAGQQGARPALSQKPAWVQPQPRPIKPFRPLAPSLRPSPGASPTSTPAPEASAPATTITPPPYQAPVAPQRPVANVPDPAQPAPSPELNVRGEIGSLLANLEVRDEDTSGKYSREAFGKGWTRTNGCYTRHVILARDLTDLKREGDCKVIGGVLKDPYTGMTINFVAGKDTSDDVQIDHVVALRDAWGKGAQALDKERRINFANDPLNLLAVDGPTNNAKGHKSADSWLPPNKDFHCEYVARQVGVKSRYRLWVTAREQRAMRDVLATCPAMRVNQDRIEKV